MASLNCLCISLPTSIQRECSRNCIYSRLLKRTLDKNKIPFDYSGTDGSKITNVYIRGINNIYEFDYGEMSGWMYKVNGKFPDTSCGNYVLKSGDVIEWLYTKDIGNDLED